PVLRPVRRRHRSHARPAAGPPRRPPRVARVSPRGRPDQRAGPARRADRPAGYVAPAEGVPSVTRVLYISSDAVGEEMAGPGRRAYELTRALQPHADVTLAAIES